LDQGLTSHSVVKIYPRLQTYNQTVHTTKVNLKFCKLKNAQFRDGTKSIGDKTLQM